METINELVNEIYEDNYSHLELNDSMGGDLWIREIKSR